jgi:hypothetical protein
MIVREDGCRGIDIAGSAAARAATAAVGGRASREQLA